MNYLTKEELILLEQLKLKDINKKFLKFLLGKKVSLEVIYLCLFFLNTEETSKKEFENSDLSSLNVYFSSIVDICNLKIDLSLGNSYEDYRNLIVIRAKDVRVILAILYIRLYTMERLKKVDFNQKIDYGKNTLKIYAPLAHRLGIGELKTSLEELSLYYIDNEKFKEIVFLLENKKDLRNKEVQNTIEVIKEIASDEIEFNIFGRSKSIYSIYKKVYEGKKEFNQIYDFQGIRIICNTKEECYTMLGKIHEIFEPLPHRFKDYILLKKPNLYQSIHTSVYDQNKNIYEIQIRTYEMDEIAEKGIAAHWIYKEGNKARNSSDIEDSLHIFRDSTKGNEIEAADIFERVVYTYTPNGKIIILPKGATIIDFAYRIHSKVAEHMVGAIVNNKIETFGYKLKNGDVIQINTSKTIKTVQKEWLEIAFSLHSKRKIKSYLNKIKAQNKINNEEEGKKLLEHHLRHGKLKVDIINDLKIQDLVLKALSYKSIEKVYSDFYTSNLALKDINKVNIDEEEDTILNKLKSSSNIISGYDIEVPGIDSIKLDFAKCCYPVYGDGIIGVIKNGKSITIHKDDCKNIYDSNKLDVKWTKENRYKYLSKLYVETLYTNKVLNTIVSALSKDNIQVKSINYKVVDKGVKINLEIEVKNKESLNNIVNVLKNIGEDTVVKVV